MTARIQIRENNLLESHLNSILDRKTDENIAHFVWAELVK